MKLLFDRLFIVYCLAWCTIHVFRNLYWPIPFLNGYLTNFIAVPAMAHVTLTFTRIFVVREKNYIYPLSYLLFIALYVSVIFEWIMPHLNHSYTRDWWDVVAYFAGSIWYYRFHQVKTA